MTNYKCLGVIPARYPSTRLPYKPLRDIRGKTLLQRVWEQARKAKNLAEVVIATDDERIRDLGESFGARVMMTSDQHLTGSDRVAEVMTRFESEGKPFPLVANVQGDMPFINPVVIDRTIAALAESDPSFGMSTVSLPLVEEEEYLRPSSVKVVFGADHGALYFSRSPIPHWRQRPAEGSITEERPWSYKHVGLYVFRPEVLRGLSALPPSIPEEREALEQLRALANGVRIKVAVASRAEMQPSIEVDTMEDLERAIAAAEEFDRR